MSPFVKWMFLGASVAALNQFKRAQGTPGRIKQQAAGVARKGVVAIAGLMVASTILSAGVIIAINNWFGNYESTGSFTLTASVWGGVILALLGGMILYLAWPRENIQKEDDHEHRGSELQETIILALKGYVEEKRQQREMKRNKRHVRSVS